MKATIAAIATPQGRGGIGVIRLSGERAIEIAEQISGKKPVDRKAIYTHFKNQVGEIIDSGLMVQFAAPNSFTGEDVVELQGHGSPIVQDMLIERLVELGARQARAGEFSERAFLNDKVDLAQAEAIADLINSQTQQAAKGAMQSLRGVFSDKIDALLKELIYLRMYVEAAIDFPEEEIDFLADDKLRAQIKQLQQQLKDTLKQAQQGSVLQAGLKVVLAGRPNAGKSSLLNALAGHDAAIVTDIPGTTRDSISQSINVDGLAVHFIDTAGLRESNDTVEKIGILKTHQAIQEADIVVYLIDASDVQSVAEADNDIAQLDLADAQLIKVFNKLDQTTASNDQDLFISAKTGEGLNQLKQKISELAGYDQKSETIFTARRRHLVALEATRDAVDRGVTQLEIHNAGELLAEELLQAQNSLSEITGEFSADDLLGEIFAGFCIGK